jgi:hypothetical protein
MELYQNTLKGLRCRNWTKKEAVAYFVKGVARELKIMPDFFQKLHKVEVLKREEKEKYDARDRDLQIFKEKWRKINGNETYFDFGVCKLPDVSESKEILAELKNIFEDTFLFPCFLNDNYDKYLVHFFDRFMGEGPYGYTDGNFDVTVRKNDVVIDAGAWIGDFAAYAANKGATVFAFEPVSQTYQLLKQTCSLNNVNGGGNYPFSARTEQLYFRNRNL